MVTRGNDTVCNLVKVSMDAIRIISPLDNITIYPNPAGDNITIEGAQDCDVTIFNILGQMIQGYKVTINKQTVNISQFLDGVYIIRITNNVGEQKNVQLLKE